MKEVRIIINDNEDLLAAIKAMAKAYKQKARINKLPDIELKSRKKSSN